MTIPSTSTSRPLLPGLMADMARYGVVFAPDDGSGFEDERREDGTGEATTDELSDADLDDGSKPVIEPEADDEADAENAFLKGFKPVEEPAVKPVTPPVAKPGEPAKPTVPDPNAAQATDLADDVVVKVGDKTVKAADLKALFARNDEIVAQSAAVVEQNTKALARAEVAKGVIDNALKQAEAAFKPYSELNFFALAKDPSISAETIETLQKEGKAAYDHVMFLRAEGEKLDATAGEARVTIDAEKAKACIATLTADFPKEFEGETWSEDRYKSLLEFGEKHGFKEARTSVHAVTFKLLRMAQKYEEGKAAAAKATRPATNQPNRPMRSQAPGSATVRGADLDTALTRLRRSGSSEAAEDAFMAGFASRADA